MLLYPLPDWKRSVNSGNMCVSPETLFCCQRSVNSLETLCELRLWVDMWVSIGLGSNPDVLLMDAADLQLNSVLRWHITFTTHDAFFQLTLHPGKVLTYFSRVS